MLLYKQHLFLLGLPRFYSSPHKRQNSDRSIYKKEVDGEEEVCEIEDGGRKHGEQCPQGDHELHRGMLGPRVPVRLHDRGDAGHRIRNDRKCDREHGLACRLPRDDCEHRERKARPLEPCVFPVAIPRKRKRGDGACADKITDKKDHGPRCAGAELGDNRY